MSRPVNGFHKSPLGGAVQTDLLALSDNISQQSKGIAEYLQANRYAAPTFAAGSSEPPATKEYLALRSNLKSSLEDLLRLVDGPTRHIREFFLLGYDLAAFQVALDFDFFNLVPVNGEISLEELAKKAGLDLDRVSRIVRMMAVHRYFQEVRPGYVSHTAGSYALREDEELRCVAHYTLDEMWKAASATSQNLQEYPYKYDSDNTPFKTRHGVPIFKYYAQNPSAAGRFARAMAGAAKNGSTDMLAEGQALLDDDVRDRISFMQHDFLKPNPCRDAGAFLIRQCTHNWCDSDVVTMFRSIVPGLEGSKPGTPFLINDIVMPEPGTWPRHAEHDLRQIDMIMMVAFGAKQRTAAEFAALLKEADSRYEITKVFADGPLGMIEVQLRQ
ncbi:MAG: hypothetical protein Q9227_005444 [Pyrenula ochraceoflavens]